MGEHNDKRHFICWMDIIGFSQLLTEKGTQWVARAIQSLAVDDLWHILFEWVDGPGGGPGRQLCEIEIFQDTIVLWTREVDAESLHSVVHVAAHLAGHLAKQGMPVRGGLSAGAIYVSSQDHEAPEDLPLTLGEGVLNARGVEQNVPFAGIVIDARLATEHTEAWHQALNDLIKEGLILEYAATPQLQAKWVVGWPKTVRPATNARDLDALMWQHLPAASPRSEAIQAATYQFLDHWYAEHADAI